MQPLLSCLSFASSINPLGLSVFLQWGFLAMELMRAYRMCSVMPPEIYCVCGFLAFFPPFHFLLLGGSMDSK